MRSPFAEPQALARGLLLRHDASPLLLLAWAVVHLAPPALAQPAAESTVDHTMLDALLHTYVEENGVDYGGLKAEQGKLEAYIRSLSRIDVAQLSESEQKALFINAYNAATLLLILENLSPELNSIMDIDEQKRWKHQRWTIGGETYSLDQIEHQVLRPRFDDPRVHAAINCASISCPDLRPEAYTAKRIDEQLDEQCRRFVNDPRHLRVENGKLHASAIFTWFKRDFEKNAGSVVAFLMKHADPPLRRKLKSLGDTPHLTPLPYDWRLNRAPSPHTRKQTTPTPQSKPRP